MRLPSESRSLWLATTPETSYPALAGDLEVDVAIVGAGLTGLVAAWLLTEAGKRVAVLEQGRIVSGETGHTTAHVTELVDTRYHVIERDFGREGAQPRGAIEPRRDRLDRAHVPDARDRVRLRARAGVSLHRARERHRLPAEGVRRRRPRGRARGVRAGGAAAVPDGRRAARGATGAVPPAAVPAAASPSASSRAAGSIFELTHMTGVTDGEPCEVETRSGHGARARRHRRRQRAGEQLGGAHHEAAGVPHVCDRRARRGRPIPRGLYWDTDDPYHYTRTQPTDEGEVLIIGGEDHKTGTETETLQRFESLLDYARSHFGVEQADYRWSGQIIEPVDGLPFIGLNTASAARLRGDRLLGQRDDVGHGRRSADERPGARASRTPYAELYKATRVKPLAAAKDFITENIDFPKHLVRDRTTNADVQGDNPALVPKGVGPACWRSTA